METFTNILTNYNIRTVNMIFYSNKMKLDYCKQYIMVEFRAIIETLILELVQ